MINLLGVKVDIVLRACKMAKHSDLYEEAERGKITG